MNFSGEGFSERYAAEVEFLAHRAAARMQELGVTQVIIDRSMGVDGASPAVQSLAADLFAARLAEGYELSHNQMCNGLYGAAGDLGILIDPMNQ